MSVRDLNICCQVDPQFGTIDVQKRMGCDQDVSFLACDCDPAYPCTTPGDPCILPALSICTLCPSYTPGATSYTLTLTDELNTAWTRCGEGTVAVTFNFDLIGCPTAYPGTGTDPCVAGDYIVVTCLFCANVGDTTIYYSTQANVLVNMDPATGTDCLTGGTASFDALTGASGSMSFTSPFTDPGWDGYVCQGGYFLVITVNGFHADNSPANFAMKQPSGGYAITISGGVGGICCAHPNNYVDVDP